MVKAFKSWNKNEPYSRSATIAYYTLFSLPSLLIIIVSIAGRFFGRKAVEGRITSEIGRFIGSDAADAIQSMISNAWLSKDSTFAIIFGVGMLLFGATGVFVQLKLAMNNIWNVAEKRNDFWGLLLDRAISFGMILVIGLLLLVSLVLSALLNLIKEKIHFIAPNITGAMLYIINFVISFFVITSLFMAVFKILPNIKIKWKTTFWGASLTTILFLIGEYLISFYFGTSEPTSVYGGASSVVLILLWVYYACMILFYGAEFTVQYALAKNEKIQLGRNGEPAIYQEMEKLEKKKIQLKEEKRIIDRLKENLRMAKKDKNPKS
ncbi:MULTISPECIES: YihY/virulence factor BrkB family protein [unclassified Zunongwangia]|uniref:YihY/virulence factor BrkB family protein n=1 Tax=unclassified Zunongwangia TaxID=2632541 RepID=UPI0022DDC27E|nr:MULTISPECIES: YihY/virulence factor BrkB family protein [unclassified Zunongwangia]WBL20798.1 YihY/virulence factor BrkB family protein [Zunongwangia sp. HRR-M8]WBL27325.1 YihY/virulence factor BrkB family protein [Zunongwangia sp. HGR-M22]